MKCSLPYELSHGIMLLMLNDISNTQTVFSAVDDKCDSSSFFFFHLQNNLNYAICIQRQWDYCTVTYGNEVDNVEYDFQMVNVDSGEIPNWI